MIKGNYRYSKENSVVVLVVNYQAPDAKYRKLVDTAPPERIQGISDDFEYLAIKMCYKFLKYIRSRTITIDGATHKMSDYENTFLKNLLLRYQNFLLIQPEVQVELLEKVVEILESGKPLNYETIEGVLLMFEEPDHSKTIDTAVDRARNAVFRKIELRQ